MSDEGRADPSLVHPGFMPAERGCWAALENPGPKQRVGLLRSPWGPRGRVRLRGR